MEIIKGYIKNSTPSIPFPSLPSEMLKLDDSVWKEWIFYHLLEFFQKYYNNEELKNTIERAKQNPKLKVENEIAKFIRNTLRYDKHKQFKKFTNQGFLIEGGINNDLEKEGIYDISFLHSFWRKNKEEEVVFHFECKNLKEKSKSNLIGKYVDNGVYRFFNGQYAQNQNFGGMIGFVLEGNYLNIKTKIHKNLKEKFDITPEGEGYLKKIDDNKNNDFTFDSYHNRKKKEFVIHHLLFEIQN